ncbi:MAG: hypothetical protein JST00_44075 [Deltaproteobacteria bacterium]|nr:hypothetical protein [Deltaproteobacteria bacterium]
MPFVVGPLLARLIVPPLGESIAKAALAISPSAAPSTSAAPDQDDDLRGDDPAPAPKERHRSRQASSRNHAAAKASSDAGATSDAGEPKSAAPKGINVDAPSKGTITVPASTIAKAIEKKDVGATNVNDPDGKPLGARMHGVGKYKAGLRDGDVIVYVAGSRTENTQQMVDAATRALAAGATSLSGKILRDGDIYDVVLELPLH